MRAKSIMFCALIASTSITVAYAVQINDAGEWEKCRDEVDATPGIEEVGVQGYEAELSYKCGKPPAKEPATQMAIVGMHPNEVVGSKMWGEKFEAITKDKYEELVDRLTVANVTTREGDWIVGDGCKAHHCKWDNAIMGINTKTKKVFALMLVDGVGVMRFGSIPTHNAPASLQRWLDNNK